MISDSFLRLNLDNGILGNNERKLLVAGQGDVFTDNNVLIADNVVEYNILLNNAVLQNDAVLQMSVLANLCTAENNAVSTVPSMMQPSPMRELTTLASSP